MEKLKNYSDKQEWELHNIFPKKVLEKATSIIALPDINQGKAPLPTGSVAVFDLNFTHEEEVYQFTESDVGCGMLLIKSSLKKEEFNKKEWDAVGLEIKKRKGKLGDLGSGNHFIDAIIDIEDNALYFLIHTGSRDKSKEISELISKKKYKEFHNLYNDTIEWANQNRLTISHMLEKYFGKTEIIIHNNHNHYEIDKNKFIVRKGAVKVKDGELAVIPSNMVGEIALVKAKNTIEKIYNSLSHGTGRIMSRSNAKKIQVDYKSIRKKIYIPEYIKNESLRTESPEVYRSLNEVLDKLSEFIELEKLFIPIAYLGQL